MALCAQHNGVTEKINPTIMKKVTSSTDKHVFDLLDYETNPREV